jgi:Icc-related predicted phosphoesterase
VKILAVSDKVIDHIYSPAVRERFADVDLVLGCGDLPYNYLEYLVDQLKAPVLYVRGNHANAVEYTVRGERTEPWGAVDLHRRVLKVDNLILLGFEGSVRYRRGPQQYTQTDMWYQVIGLLPRLLWNRLVHGRAFDILVTHAPPWGIHDQEDLAHHGFKAFRWLLEAFQPRYHLHGHIHLYTTQSQQSRFCATEVINVYGYCHLELEP